MTARAGAMNGALVGQLIAHMPEPVHVSASDRPLDAEVGTIQCSVSPLNATLDTMQS